MDIELTAEFATAEEVENLAETLAGLGHDVTVIGDMAALVRFLGCGGAVDLVFNYAAGVWAGRARPRFLRCWRRCACPTPERTRSR